ncbi:GyrI-like domain-containing protein [Cellulosimicrobium arenosum]|uniref:GyrI-like domain-containing protein n=1 Tax=Cellulosimicrobium arenosum TaxID=2708133 RepID=A0A927IZS0_9MICO|nr:GyrI-like domain-containing protein [Cellulosimicrobium arenosum]MBD8078683.1 GyrI-like domain-containing protein [Cellulosimicrobium arenosum]
MAADATEKVDLKVLHRELYAPPRGRFVEVDVPELTYLAVDGEGDPNSATSYREAVETLFGLSYAVKFASRKRLGRDHVVGPLEGLWTAEDPRSFVRREKGAWRWTLLVLQPDWVGANLVDEVTASVRATKDLPALDLVERRTLTEGRSVQTLHVGSYDDEAPVLAELHDVYLPAHDLTFAGPHHEVYLSDVRRTAPERLRTILRQPVRAAG